MRRTTLIAVHIGQPATVKDFGNDKAVINFSVADTEHYTNKENVKVETTTWIECKWYMPTANANKMAPYLTKGKKLYLEGKSEARAYLNKEGKAVAMEGLVVDKILFLDKKEGTTSGSTQTATAGTTTEVRPPVDLPNNSNTAIDDDLPF